MDIRSNLSHWMESATKYLSSEGLHLVTGSPSANLLIKPNGAVAVLSTHEQIFAPNFCFIGAAFPQSSVPHEIVHDAALAIGQRCFEEGVIGHVGVDFV